MNRRRTSNGQAEHGHHEQRQRGGVVAGAEERATGAKGPTLRLGSRGDAVRYVQQRLVALGYDPGPVDGVYGWLTFAAVRDFQRDFRLDVDGVVGRRARAVLFDDSLTTNKQWTVVAELAPGTANSWALRTLLRQADVVSAVAVPVRMRADETTVPGDDDADADGDDQLADLVRTAIGHRFPVWAAAHIRANDVPGQYPRGTLQSLLHSRRGTARFVQFVERAAALGPDGVCLDVGQLRWGDGARFVSVLKRVAQRLDATEQAFAVSLPMRDLNNAWTRLSTDIDYAATAAVASFIVLTPPARAAGSDPPRPPSARELATALRAVLRHVPPWRCLLTVSMSALAFPHSATAPGWALPYHRAIALAYKTGQRPQWDSDVGRSVFHCQLDEEDASVWPETRDSFAAKIELAKRFRLAGVYVTGVGQEDARLWRVLRQSLRRRAAAS